MKTDETCKSCVWFIDESEKTRYTCLFDRSVDNGNLTPCPEIHLTPEARIARALEKISECVITSPYGVSRWFTEEIESSAK